MTLTRSPAAPGHRAAIGHAAGFWTVAAAYVAVLAFATVPTPLHRLHQAEDGFPTRTITVVLLLSPAVPALLVARVLTGVGAATASLPLFVVALALAGAVIVAFAAVVLVAVLGASTVMARRG